MSRDLFGGCQLDGGVKRHPRIGIGRGCGWYRIEVHMDGDPKALALEAEDGYSGRVCGRLTPRVM